MGAVTIFSLYRCHDRMVNLASATNATFTSTQLNTVYDAKINCHAENEVRNRLT